MNSIDTDPRGSTMISDFQTAGRLVGSIFADDFTDLIDDDLPRINGYLIDRRLGRGGGGQVFHALREGSSKSLALKLLNKSLAQRDAANRAWRELDLLSDLRLAGVPEIQDYGMHEGRMYIVTAHIEGLTLADHCTQKNLDRRARVELLARIADCVQQLHEHGIIHRDIKPDNIIINANGEPVIVDFGIASLLSDDATETLTQDGIPIGTPAFMAPEQARGDRNHTSTRSDVYGLGATACLVLTGKTPHDVSGPLHAAIQRVSNQPPRNPLELDPTLDRSLAFVLRRAFAPSPEERYPSAAALAEDLRRWLRNDVIEWQGPNWFKRQALAWRRDPKRFVARATVFALVILCIGTTVSAIGSARLAKERQLLAEGQLELRLKEEKLRDNETKRAAHWKEQAERIDADRQALRKLQEESHQLRQKQSDRVRKAIEQGQIFESTLLLLNFAEAVQLEAADDKESLDLFIDLAHRAIETFTKQTSTP